jgi:hypothetical protein
MIECLFGGDFQVAHWPKLKALLGKPAVAPGERGCRLPQHKAAASREERASHLRLYSVFKNASLAASRRMVFNSSSCA